MIYLIQRFRKLVAKLYGRTKHILQTSLLMFCCFGFTLLFHAGNAFCMDSSDNWNRISGPFSIVNQSPIQLLFLQPLPDRAETYPNDRYSISLTTAMTNTLLWEISDHYHGHIDMEMIRSTLELKYGLLPRVEIGMSIPFVYGYGGFMDHGIFEFEEVFNASRYLRKYENSSGKKNDYIFLIQKDGKTFIEGKEQSSGLGDIALRIKGKILDEDDIIPCVSGRFSIKTPTGDDERALGSGAVDYGFGLLLQKTFTSFTTYLNADFIIPGNPYKHEDVSIRSFYNIMLGAEYKLTEQLSALIQLSYITRPFRNTGLDVLGKTVSDVSLGLSYATKTGLCIQGGLIEGYSNSSADAGADITFFLNVGKNF
jgi:hypothetical protein